MAKLRYAGWRMKVSSVVKEQVSSVVKEGLFLGMVGIRGMVRVSEGAL